jgi:hypothetical protein
MTKLTQRMNGNGVPTQSQPQAASLTLSACNVAIRLKDPQNYWVFGLFPSSGILETRKYYVSETGSISVRRCGGEDTHLGPL